MPGFGFHEVLVESPHHLQTFDQLPINQVEEILWAIKSRFDHYAEQPDIQTGVMFKNHGRDAGASQAHPHCQLLALPVIPVVLQEELDGWQKHFTDTGNCVFCELLEQELEEKVRIVYENDAFVVLCPYASRFAYETWILPKDHHAHFGPENSAGNLSFRNLAEVIQVTVQKVRRGLGDPSFNIVLHTAPFNHPDDKFHWYLEVLPVTQRIAGFEWGTGCHINPVPSEEAATFLRTVPYQIVPPRQLPHVTPDQALQDTEIDQTDETLSSGLAKKDLLEA
jgi:UDPglucose--hexose-1-phosphate uridylyltransferase